MAMHTSLFFKKKNYSWFFLSLWFYLHSTSRLSPPPTSLCPAWWSSFSSSKRRCLVDMSATLHLQSYQYDHTHMHTCAHTHKHTRTRHFTPLCFVFADEVFFGLQIRGRSQPHPGCCLQVQEWPRMVRRSFQLVWMLNNQTLRKLQPLNWACAVRFRLCCGFMCNSSLISW